MSAVYVTGQHIIFLFSIKKKNSSEWVGCNIDFDLHGKRGDNYLCLQCLGNSTKCPSISWQADTGLQWGLDQNVDC